MIEGIVKLVALCVSLLAGIVLAILSAVICIRLTIIDIYDPLVFELAQPLLYLNVIFAVAGIVYILTDW